MTKPATSPLDSLLHELRRRPDVETPELRAWDAADRYLLDTAEPWLRDRPAEVAVIEDTHGALTLGALALGAQRVRVHQDSLVARRALEANVTDTGVAAISHHALADVVSGDAHLIFLRLPRSLDRLDAIAREVARSAHPDAVLLAGNMVKHMTPTQNDVLRRSWQRVDVSLARQKARLLTAREPRDVTPLEPAVGEVPEHGLRIVAHAGVFGGASLDIGTRALLEVAEQWPAYETAIDLACGTGVLAVALARRAPTARVIATDVSAVAVESARLTADANGVEVDTVQDDGLSTQPTDSADLIVLNPPFHVGAAVHTGVALRLFAEAGRVLRPGGQLWSVWNSHLDYAPALERAVGPTRQVSRGPKFTVTVSRRR
ncbi:class I SAM-dependent methyltransferase [Chryseoglobus sp. 28M-23]|uniref:class I SAM-dependent methyltransferase n=1 Tax=Chryseoglobus sp. 28M-23 TaxID=2772253 RepID=UPI001CD162CD|nr:class I SAM-dependent methyltransferase [Chryseoglobus sp. 28M-23]